MDYSVDTSQISFDHASVRVPANVFARTWRARQAVDPVSSRLQLRDQSRPDKSLRPAHENVHDPPPYASVSCTHMVTTTQSQNRMNSPTLLCPPHNPVKVRSTHPAFARYLLDDRIYLTNLHILVLPSVWMVSGCVSDGSLV